VSLTSAGLRGIRPRIVVGRLEAWLMHRLTRSGFGARDVVLLTCAGAAPGDHPRRPSVSSTLPTSSGWWRRLVPCNGSETLALRAYIQSATIARPCFTVAPDASDAQFLAALPHPPVFRVIPAKGLVSRPDRCR
jgi:hypothetical protein